MMSRTSMYAAPVITGARGRPMLHEQTIEKLYSLRLQGMAHALQEQMKQPDMAGLAFEERLAMLVDAQWLWKENRALSQRLKNNPGINQRQGGGSPSEFQGFGGGRPQ